MNPQVRQLLERIQKSHRPKVSIPCDGPYDPGVTPLCYSHLAQVKTFQTPHFQQDWICVTATHSIICLLHFQKEGCYLQHDFLQHNQCPVQHPTYIYIYVSLFYVYIYIYSIDSDFVMLLQDRGAAPSNTMRRPGWLVKDHRAHCSAEELTSVMSFNQVVFSWL